MSESDLIGPALPPMFQTTKGDESDEEPRPALPPVYRADSSSSSSDDEETYRRGKSNSSKCTTTSRIGSGETQEADDDDGFFGPALPPGYQKKQMSPDRPPPLGPALPPGFCRPRDEDEEANDDDRGGISGPALPPGYKPEYSGSEEDDDEDDEVVGPMPFKGDRATLNSVALDIERRAKKMKDKLTGVNDGPEEVTRETWMTELPPELQHIGLGARTFKKRSGPENKDRSIWTDTPADRERKARERQEGKKSGESTKEAPRLSRKEVEMAEKVAKYNESKRGESLISMHTKNLKRKADEEGKKPVERRAFDRDQDLQVNRFDDAQKKSLLKKSAELNTRFSHSKDRMFL
ncbi:GPALPP motifs-containing protein 1 isoform X2 [Sardina pilchardus]|uniref:GPALPP motifs-containing protein 1 isoform X2 n=1 Tax=Sardina pilchardus TaxID=27697 RepID=UPI002E1520A2